ncbi:hypothetical protein CCE28_04165 [Anaeromicrobium sediminis]|uniref:Nudix hydrolase domain-containing protein n=1 Tax=Anaeromicrobium sediminis TaxID=1478221 RepID=A0A267MPT6_9FIRM|nr:hypothetical protein CCE28_04165 [Anaeromicrobium sediminis]
MLVDKAVLGIVINKDKCLLVHRRWPPCTWGPPGGFMDKGECELETVQREIFEETEIVCEVIEKIHDFIYSDAYYNSSISVYVCKYMSGELSFDKESLDAGWFSIDEMPKGVSPGVEVFEKAFSIVKEVD